MTTYIALLRGINVGGSKKIKMEPLRAALTSLGLRNVRTLIASGNVLFETESTARQALIERIERQIQKAFDMQVSVILRTQQEIARLVKMDPFRGIRVTPRTRLFVTFLAEKPRSTLKIPYLSPDKSYRILCIHRNAVCSVLTLGKQWAKNLRQMDILEKEFGKRITTRSWSTVTKFLSA